ncbi:MAG: hypothetical protein EOO27_13975 [Comamonadaceae bacterium]|nr:MAG: hypothetical protein EOO27_13975 [Comamonadaceae bacterium]
MSAREKWLHRAIWLAFTAYVVAGFTMYGPAGQGDAWFFFLGWPITLGAAASLYLRLPPESDR